MSDSGHDPNTEKAMETVTTTTTFEQMVSHTWSQYRADLLKPYKYDREDPVGRLIAREFDQKYSTFYAGARMMYSLMMNEKDKESPR